MEAQRNAAELAELKARLAEMEAQMAESKNSPAPSSKSATSTVTVTHKVTAPARSKRKRKKAKKKYRKASKLLHKTRLHENGKCGMVSDSDRIVIPEYMVNAGYDVKFEADPCELDLKGIISPDDYFAAITQLNEAISHARAKPIDFLLLATSTILPFGLIAWAVRHRQHKTKHKKILLAELRRFNDAHVAEGLRLRWRRKPVSQLVLERFPLTEDQIKHRDPAVNSAI